jgi:hypothetical protein
MRKKNYRNNSVSSKTDYKILMQLYYLTKERKKEARLPGHDFRISAVNEKLRNRDTHFRSIKKTLTKIAAIW